MERLHTIFSFEKMDSLTFNRLDFWLFFIFIVMVFSLLHQRQLVRSIFITGVSLFLYWKTSGFFVLLLGLSITVNFLLGRAIFRSESNLRRKWIIAFSAIFNVSFLAYFKYAYFFTDSYNALMHTDYQIVNWFAQVGNGFMGEGTFLEKIFVPAGVSFFTFQSISYVVDIYRKEIEPVKNYFDYSFYVTYFPHVIMGPIVRARDFIPQIYKPFHLDSKVFGEAVFLILKGLIKKIVLADFIAMHFIDRVVDAPEAYPGFVSVLAMWGYSLQIYGDFSGYTDVAIGISRLMGFELLPNFNSPYKALSVADFWRRWHISLGSWWRDYLYIPLGGNKKGSIGTYVAISVIFFFLIFLTGWYDLFLVYLGLMALNVIAVFFVPALKRVLHRDQNLLIIMTVGGLWHGASLNFVTWGIMNGFALVLYNYWKKISPYEKSSWWMVHFWRIFLTFNFITFTRIWFRLQGDGEPFQMLDQIWNHFGFTWEKLGTVLYGYGPVFCIMAAGFILHWLPQRFKDFGIRRFVAMPMPAQAIVVWLCVLLLYQAYGSGGKAFVYIEF